MKSLSKLSFIVSALSLIFMLGARVILGVWHPVLYVLLAIFVLALLTGVLLDYKFYLGLLSVKTARKGLSLGWSLLLVFVFLTAISYLVNRFDKTFDLTSEKLNSLSEQSLTTLKDIDSKIVFYIFYKGNKKTDTTEMFKNELKDRLNLYKQKNSKIKTALIDAYKEPLKAEQYLSDLPDKEQKDLFVFVNYKTRKIRVEEPFGEEELTSALIKAKKREFKDVLFLTGHGERELNSSSPGGLKILNQALEDSGFYLKEWNFIKQGAPSNKPAVIASLGPRQSFSEAEKGWLKEYLSTGGRLILALDPKEKHNLKDFLQDYGVIYKDNFILSQLSLVYGTNLLTAFGNKFDSKHSITKKLSSKQVAVFEQASSLDVSPKAFEDFKFSFLVETGNNSAVFNDLKNTKEAVKSILPGAKLNSFQVALTVSNKTTDEGKKDFELLVMGDSDFLSNRYIDSGANRDLALNSFVSLAGEEELVSIRPKQPKGTKISLKRHQQMSLVLAYVIFPLIFLMTGFLMWYRKRSA